MLKSHGASSTQSAKIEVMPYPVRPNVLRMKPYSPGKPIEEVEREYGVHDPIKLASNENPLGPSPLAVQAIRDAAQCAHRYPDAAGFGLRGALARATGLPADQIVLGNGSDELIQYLGQVLIDNEEDEVLCGDPSFVRYDSVADLAPCRLVKVPLDASMRHDLRAMAERVTEHTKIVFIANPNNPTGTIVRRGELGAFIANLPEKTVLVLDEAYFEYARVDPDYPDSLAYIRDGASVVSLRTFSKAYGLAGIRVGYALAAPELADAINRIRQPFNVSSIAQSAALAALEDWQHVERGIRVTQESLRRIRAKLEQHGCVVYESLANFVFADLKRSSTDIFRKLLHLGVIVRPGDMFGTPNCVRISAGTPDEMDKFEIAFDAAMGTEESR